MFDRTVRAFFLTTCVLSISLLAAGVSAVEIQSRLNQNQAHQTEKLNLGIQFGGVQYFSETAADSNLQQQVEAQARFEHMGRVLVKADGLVGTYNLDRSSYFAVPELFIGVAAAEPANSIVLGRKIHSLSALDQNENFGFFNSYFTNDFINFREQGLTGLHAEGRALTQFGPLGFYAGYLPLYFPNQGPQVYEQDGEIKSSNRWAQKPPSRFRFGSSEREIVYAIRSYEIDEIVKNSGEAASLYWGGSSSRPWVRISYARKPVNEIPLTRETYGTTSNFTGQVRLSPVVTYEQVQSVDLSYDVKPFKTTLSYLEDRVFNQAAAADETLQFLTPVRVLGAWFAADLSDYFTRTTSAEISYSEITGGEIKDLMADGRNSLFTFSSQRTRFRKPFSFKLTTDLFQLQKRVVKTQIKWTYDSAYKGTLLSGAASYQPLAKIQALNLNIGFDLLGVEQENTEENFLQSKQANDRVYAGVQYVF